MKKPKTAFIDISEGRTAFLTVVDPTFCEGEVMVVHYGTTEKENKFYLMPLTEALSDSNSPSHVMMFVHLADFKKLCAGNFPELKMH